MATSKAAKGKKKSLDASVLPSSQEEKIKIEVKEELFDDESEYESAEENLSDDTVVSGPKRDRYEPPARPVPPPGVADFDLENWNDPNAASEYAMDAFYYYKSREVI